MKTSPSRTPAKPRCRSQDLNAQDRQRMLELVGMKYGAQTIADHMGTSRKVVRKILDELRQPDLISAEHPPRMIDPFLDQIAQRVAKGLTASRILREITTIGYKGGRTMLAQHVSKMKAKLPRQARRQAAKRRFETKMAEEMQFDWSPGLVEIAGRQTRVHVLGVILGWSRRLFIGLYRDERESTLLEGLATAFHYFQGCAMRCVTDNMSTVVLGRVGADRKPLWHPRFLDFSRHYGFQPFLCAVADPDRKGYAK